MTRRRFLICLWLPNSQTTLSKRVVRIGLAPQGKHLLCTWKRDFHNPRKNFYRSSCPYPYSAFSACRARWTHFWSIRTCAALPKPARRLGEANSKVYHQGEVFLVLFQSRSPLLKYFLAEGCTKKPAAEIHSVHFAQSLRHPCKSSSALAQHPNLESISSKYSRRERGVFSFSFFLLS